MVHHTAWATALFASLAVAQSYPPDAVDKLATDSLPKLKEWLAKNPQDGCTFETAARRREWSVTSFRL
jgi:tyrosinase